MKGNLILWELLVMVLVFALAVGACLGVFVQSRHMAEETARLDAAVALAQNAAELFRAGKVADGLDWGGLTLKCTPVPSEIPGFSQEKIEVYCENTPLYTLTAARVEVTP